MEVVSILLIIILILLAIVSPFYIFPWLIGAPYDPTRKKSLKTIIQLSKPIKGKKIAELGSGDGRIAIELAKLGAKVDGFEINPFLVWFSKRKIKKLGLGDKIKIYKKNFWNISLENYDLIVLFQFRSIMKKLEMKIKKECKNSIRIISNTWKFPNLKLIKEENNIFLYHKL